MRMVTLTLLIVSIVVVYCLIRLKLLGNGKSPGLSKISITVLIGMVSAALFGLFNKDSIKKCAFQPQPDEAPPFQLIKEGSVSSDLKPVLSVTECPIAFTLVAINGPIAVTTDDWDNWPGDWPSHWPSHWPSNWSSAWSSDWCNTSCGCRPVW